MPHVFNQHTHTTCVEPRPEPPPNKPPRPEDEVLVGRLFGMRLHTTGRSVTPLLDIFPRAVARVRRVSPFALQQSGERHPCSRQSSPTPAPPITVHRCKHILTLSYISLSSSLSSSSSSSYPTAHIAGEGWMYHGGHLSRY